MTPRESSHRDYGLLAGFLRAVSFRFLLRTSLEFFLLLLSGLLLVLLGGFFPLELKETLPYLPFFYALLAILFLSSFILLWIGRLLSRPSMEQLARRLEERFPQLRDDVTNCLLLFHQLSERAGAGQISEGLIAAQLRKTADEVSAIHPKQVVNLKKAFRHLRLLLPLLLTFSLILIFDPPLLGRSLALMMHPLSNLPMKEISISLEPKGSTVLRGTQVTIEAKTTGSAPSRVMLAVWSEGSETMSFPMESEGNGRFVYRMASARSSFRYQASSGRSASPIYQIRVVDAPEIGKVRLTLIPPDYTGLPEERKEGGQIEALKGSVANLEAEVTKGVKEGKVILNQESEFLLKVEADRPDHLKGSLPVFYPGTYSIKVKDDLGFENPNPVRYQIRMIPDKYPEAEMRSPAKDLEISGNEIIPIVYTAKDDFGITAVRLRYEMGGMERFISLRSGDNGRLLGPETFKWDLGGLALTAGDKVVYRLEVSDNDSVSGPKVGYSRAFTLSVRDEGQKAKKEVEEAQQIAEALLDLLADQIEESRDKESLAKGMDDVLARLDRDLQRMGERPERFDVEALRRNLSSLKERIPQESRDTATQEMERLALLAEDIAKRARMNEVEALAREMRNRQRRLVDFLNDLKAPPTREGLETLLKELKKVEDLLRSVMEALSKFASGLPDEFMNSQELSGLDFHDLFKDLEEMKNRLAAGDISGALEAAQRLLQALSEMMASLGKAGARAGMAPYDRLQGEMAQQTSELGRILAEQKEVLGETERIDKGMRERVEEETGERLSHALSRFKEILIEVKRSLPPEQRDLIDEFGTILDRGNLERFSQLTGEFEKELSGREELQRLVRELRQRVEALRPDPKGVMKPDDKEKFPGLSLREDGLTKRTGNLQERLEMLAQLFPGMDTEILNDLREARGFMGKASGRLTEEDAPGAIPPEQEAITRLARSQQAMQQMAQQMAMRMQAARWGYPLVYDPRPGWYYGPWAPMPTLPQPELRRPLEKGFTGIDREEFDPPSKDAYQVPKIFREKILDSLKEGIPSAYKREVEKYFRGLTE